MFKRPVHYLVYGHVFGLIGILICIWLEPAGLGTNDGISYYGTHRQTIFPYVVGLGSYGLFYLAASSSLPKSRPFLFTRYMFRLFALLTMGVMATPYVMGPYIDEVHITLGTVLFASQFLMGIRLVFFVYRDRLNLLLFCLQLASGLLAGVYFIEPHGLLLQSEVLFQLAFGMLLMRTLAHMIASGQTVTGRDGVRGS